MREYLPVLQKVPLFASIKKEDLLAMLPCLGARVRRVQKDESILLIGDKVDFIGIILEGSVKIVRENITGSQDILAELGEADVFAEVFVCAGVESSPVTVLAGSDAAVMLVNFKRIISTCSSSCAFHTRLIQNMLHLIAQKNMQQNFKNELLSKRTTREKLTFYLLNQMQAKGSSLFTLPFNRSELADYLCVDRSALSRELSAMKNEGLLDYQKNQFTLQKLLHIDET